MVRMHRTHSVHGGHLNRVSLLQARFRERPAASSPTAKPPASRAGTGAAAQSRRGRTSQLGLRQVLLPPEVLVHGREDGQPVVGVHEDVDEAVQGRAEET